MAVFFTFDKDGNYIFDDDEDLTFPELLDYAEFLAEEKGIHPEDVEKYPDKLERYFIKHANEKDFILKTLTDYYYKLGGI